MLHSLETVDGINQVVDENGFIALKHRQPGQRIIQNTPSKTEYVFITRANICMGWVNPIDVQYILNIKGGCCGQKRNVFSYANEDDVRRWTNGGGR